MKVKPKSKSGGVREPRPKEKQLPAQSLPAAPGFKLKTILVPMDFSDCARKALQYAVPFARQFGAELKLLHVVEPYAAMSEMGLWEVETIERNQKELETLRKTIDSTVPSTATVQQGMASSEIAQAARDWHADLIIISTHGRKGLTRMLLGSTTEKVVRHAPCPVLVVRESEREFVSEIAPKNN